MDTAADTEVQRQFALMSEMNITMVRFDFDWSVIEPIRGQFDWSHTDRMVSAAAAHGIRVLALLTYAPEWARAPGTTTHAPPRDLAEFAEFARAATERYAPRGVNNWEVWNEPNIVDFWEPRPDADEYSALFRATAAAIRSLDPAATVITGGLTRGTTTDDGSRIAQTEFVDDLYANGTAQLADAIAVHPYSFPDLPVSDVPARVGSIADLPALRGVMEQWGDADKQIWVTEFGAATGSGDNVMTESQQAESLSQAVALATSWAWVGPVVIYELRNRGTDPGNLEQNFGVLRSDLTPKTSGQELLQGRIGQS
ncbi:cellulase family glycosylhydrolase [Mycobacterium sp. C31M]